MTDEFDVLTPFRPATPGRPLTGLTVLAVEDSRFASEAMRLLCLRSGARIRRADCLASAQRHLRVYRPTAAIIDLGLPDGSGESLIEELAQAKPRVPVILATSGDDNAEQRALDAGADGFLSKPLSSLAEFQQAILGHLADQAQAAGPRALPGEVVTPDPFAFRDDMVQAAEILAEHQDGRRMRYLAQFLTGVARAARDMPLEHAATRLDERTRAGLTAEQTVMQIASLVDARINATGPV